MSILLARLPRRVCLDLLIDTTLSVDREVDVESLCHGKAAPLLQELVLYDRNYAVEVARMLIAGA